MPQSLNIYTSSVRTLLLQHGGYEARVLGDAVVAVFGKAVNALHFCVDLQQSLLQQVWLALSGNRRAAGGAQRTTDCRLRGVVFTDWRHFYRQ